MNKKLTAAFLAAAMMFSAVGVLAEDIAAENTARTEVKAEETNPTPQPQKSKDAETEDVETESIAEGGENAAPIMVLSEEQSPMPEVAQSVLDSDYDRLAMSLNKTGTYKNSTYSPIKEGDVLKFDITPAVFANAATEEREITISFGTVEKIVLEPYKRNLVKYVKNGTNDKPDKQMPFEFNADGAKTYNVYISKTDGTLVFGIKNDTDAVYTYFTVENAVNAEYTSIKIGWKPALAISNDYCYTVKVKMPPMPEIAQSVLDSNYDKAAMPLNDVGTYKSTTYSPIEDGCIMKFDITPAVYANAAKEEREITISFGAVEKIVFEPYNRNQITYTNTNNKELNKTIPFKFNADGTKTYNVYISKIEGTLVFGIKNADAEEYTYFTVENAANAEYTSIKLGWKVALTTTNAYCYSEKRADVPYENNITINEDGSGHSTVQATITRTKSYPKDKALLVTVVYVTEGGSEKLHSIKFSEEKSLPKGTDVTFENTVGVPDGEYRIENYLWNTYSNLTPVSDSLGNNN